MDFKRAILIGALLWVLFFFEVSILMFGFKLSPGFTYYLIHYLFTIFLVGFASWLYFKKNKSSAYEGFALGAIFVVTGIFLDTVITIPLFVKTYTFFFDPFLLLGFLEALLIATLSGYFKSRHY